MRFAALPKFRWLESAVADIDVAPVAAPPIVRTIYINGDSHLRLVRYCLHHTVRRNPDSRMILAIDRASDNFEEWARSISPKVETFRTSGKRPRGGRMNLLMGEAMERVAAGELMVITAEQDTIFDSSIIPVLWALLERYGPKAAAMQAFSCLFNGRGCYPSASHNRRFRKPGKFDGLAYEMQFTTFWTVAWRPEALRAVDWRKTRPHVGADHNACQQLAKSGWRFYSTPHCRAIHQAHSQIRDGRKYVIAGGNLVGVRQKVERDPKLEKLKRFYATRGQLIKILQSNPTDGRRALVGKLLRALELFRLKDCAVRSATYDRIKDTFGEHTIL